MRRKDRKEMKVRLQKKMNINIRLWRIIKQENVILWWCRFREEKRLEEWLKEKDGRLDGYQVIRLSKGDEHEVNVLTKQKRRKIAQMCQEVSAKKKERRKTKTNKEQQFG